MNISALAYLDNIKKILATLPGTAEGVCYGTPGFYVKKKLLARLKEDGETLAIYTEDRNVWIKAQPDVFYFTEHYRNYPMMLVRLNKVKPKDLKQLLVEAWKMKATKTLLKEYEGKSKNE